MTPNRSRDASRSQRLFATTGWLFADLLVAGALVALFITTLPGTLLLILAAVGVAIGAMVLAYQGWNLWRTNARKRKQASLERLEQIREANPGLGAAVELLREEFGREGTRSFWLGFLQNFFFYALGLGTPIVFSRFHLF